MAALASKYSPLQTWQTKFAEGPSQECSRWDDLVLTNFFTGCSNWWYPSGFCSSFFFRQPPISSCFGCWPNSHCYWWLTNRTFLLLFPYENLMIWATESQHHWHVWFCPLEALFLWERKSWRSFHCSIVCAMLVVSRRILDHKGRQSEPAWGGPGGLLGGGGRAGSLLLLWW